MWVDRVCKQILLDLLSNCTNLYSCILLALLLFIYFLFVNNLLGTDSLSLQQLYSLGWAPSSLKSFLHPSRFRATIFQFLHPTSSSTPSSQRSLRLPLGRFPPGSLRRTLLDKSSSSWCMTCPAHLSLLSLQNFTMSFSPHSW